MLGYAAWRALRRTLHKMNTTVLGDLAGRMLGERYLVGEPIARGGMATVYLAEDLRHERRVAVKVLNPDLAQSLGTDRFLRADRIDLPRSCRPGAGSHE